MAEWSYERIERLIQLYATKPELWNPQDQNYQVRDMKRGAWNNIASEMKCSVKAVKSKVSSLLHSYWREVHKEKMSIATGNDAIYNSNWYAYKLFSFMSDVPKDLNLDSPENDCDKLCNTTEDDSADDSMSSSEPASQSTPHKPKEPEEEAAYHPAVPCPQVQSDQDDCAVYCEYLGRTLRNFNERERIVLIQQFNNLIFEAQMRRLGVKDELQD